MAMILNRKSLREALELIGAYLEDRGESLEVVGIGGSALLLLGMIERPTQDLDLVAEVVALVLTDFGVENAETRLAPGL
jgi:hypothetical protein